MMMIPGPLQKQLKTADNMTDTLAALAPLANQALSGRDEALSFFEKRWCEFPLVMDKWLRVQAVSRCHPSFVMSASFTNQTLAQIELFQKRDHPGVHCS